MLLGVLHDTPARCFVYDTPAICFVYDTPVICFVYDAPAIRFVYDAPVICFVYDEVLLGVDFLEIHLLAIGLAAPRLRRRSSGSRLP